MTADPDLPFLLAFSRSKVFTPLEKCELVRRFGSARALSGITASPIPENGFSEPQLRALRRLEKDAARAAAELEKLAEAGIHAVGCHDPRYPSRLLHTSAYPLTLFYKGDVSIFSRSPVLAVVGSRKMSAYGRRVVEKLLPELVSAGVVIVSGMAMGIDATAHEVTLACNGFTAGVQAQGVDAAYPKANRDLYGRVCERGVIVSEFATEPAYVGPEMFPRRNRIISGVSDAVLVVEAAEKSGSLVTAYLGLEQDRQIYAVPGDIDRDTSCGCLKLIRQGAKPVSAASDILEDFFPASRVQGASETPRHVPNPPLETPLEEEIFAACRENPRTLDQIVEKIGAETKKISAALVKMELSGVLSASADGSYAAPSR